MPFDIDVPTGGGAQGPFVQWQAKESTDGSIPGRSWVIRDGDGKRGFDGFARGVVLDIEALKTGWCFSTGTAGVAPEWQWNQSVSKFASQPPAKGDTTWKRGISIPMATGPAPTDYAVWEQAQAGAWQGFVQLVGLLKAANAAPGKLPVVKQSGVEKIESKRGITFAPKFEVLKWVDRPAALSAAAAGIAAEDELADAVPF